MPTKRFELSFWGKPWRYSVNYGARNFLPVAIRWRRWHPTFESAEKAALKALEQSEVRAANPAIIYGPGCGKDGHAIL